MQSTFDGMGSAARPNSRLKNQPIGDGASLAAARFGAFGHNRHFALVASRPNIFCRCLPTCKNRNPGLIARQILYLYDEMMNRFKHRGAGVEKLPVFALMPLTSSLLRQEHLTVV